MRYPKISALAVGSLIYNVLKKLFTIYMDVVHKCKLLPPYDAVFLLDREKNLANVTGALFFEPFEFETMKNYILEKTKVVNRGRSKLVQKYGLWFFQEM